MDLAIGRGGVAAECFGEAAAACWDVEDFGERDIFDDGTVFRCKLMAGVFGREEKLREENLWPGKLGAAVLRPYMFVPSMAVSGTVKSSGTIGELCG